MPDRSRSHDSAPRDATEARIIETAGHVFSETGFQAAKVRDSIVHCALNLIKVGHIHL